MSNYYRLNEDKTVSPMPIESLVEAPDVWAIDARRVGLDLVGDYEVSTVFLVIDHNFGGTPLLFETMVFATDGRGIELYCDRYPTWDAALAGHQRVVEALQSGKSPEEIES